MKEEIFYLTKNEKLPQLIFATKAQISLNIKQISKLTAENSDQKKHIKELQILLNEKFKIVEEALINYDTFTSEKIKENLLEGRRVMDRISIVIEKMLSIEQDLLLKRDITNSSLTSTTPKIIFITLFTTIAIISFSFCKNK